MYDSILTGAAWVQELLNGHETWFYDALGMAKPAFSTYREPVFLASRHYPRSVSRPPVGLLDTQSTQYPSSHYLIDGLRIGGSLISR